MNLIAEETVKLLERYPYEIAAIVDDSIAQPDWDNFVNQTLRESREREAAPLAGGRPAPARTVPTAFGAGNEDDDDREQRLEFMLGVYIC